MAVQGAVSTVVALDQILEFKWHEHGIFLKVHSRVYTARTGQII